VIDDHDMHDDWNISRSWLEEMRRRPWWQERVVAGLMSYWIYQFIGNLSPRELEQNELYRRVRELEEAGPEQSTRGGCGRRQRSRPPAPPTR